MVISANRERSSSGEKSNRFSKGHVFTRPGGIVNADAERLNLLVETMLPPQLSEYSAYSWHEQGMCEPNATGKYVRMRMGIGDERMTLRISARAVQELMAGRLSTENFQRRAMGNDNLVRQQLEVGRTISSARFEPQGLDEDDDYLVLDFRDDPAASALRLPPRLKNTADPTA
jgi:hypothetical protein